MGVLRTPDLSEAELAAAERLAATIRRLADTALRADLDAAEWDQVSDALDALGERLGPAVRDGGIRLPREIFEEALRDEVVVETGTLNPFTVPITMSFGADGASIRGDLVADPVCEGPIGKVHGGVIGWIFDIVLGALVQGLQLGAMTRSLEITYRRPTPIGVPLVCEGQAERVDERTTRITGTLRHEDTVTATAVGVFVMPRARM